MTQRERGKKVKNKIFDLTPEEPTLEKLKTWLNAVTKEIKKAPTESHHEDIEKRSCLYILKVVSEKIRILENNKSDQDDI